MTARTSPKGATAPPTLTRASPSSAAQTLFDLKQVNVSYGNRPALHDITLSIRAGERVALIGPSGAGKTTLLNKLYALRSADCAFVHQQYALVPLLSVFHNVYIGRLDRRPLWANLLNLVKPRRRDIDAIRPILATLGLREKMFEKVGTLSGGQQQRVAVGRAMFRGGSVLLADEPVASIDPLQGERVLDHIVNAGRTVIMALHSVAFARRFSQRIIGLCGGRIRFDRPAADLSPAAVDTLYRSC